MEQKIVTSNNDYAKKLLKISRTVFFVSAVIFCGLFYALDQRILPDALEFLNSDLVAYTLLAVVVVSLFLLIFAISIQKVELTVTNKRVYGAIKFGKRVDLPLDSVSAVSMSAFKGIAVGTSSGRIIFKGIGNRDEIYDAINKLIIARQESAKAEPVKQEATASSLDELKKVKDLLDAGIITQDEFEAKKKQLLNL